MEIFVSPLRQIPKVGVGKEELSDVPVWTEWNQSLVLEFSQHP